MKKFPEFENILPSEPEYDSWLWDGTNPREHEQKKQPHPEQKESKKQPNQKPEKSGKEQGPEKEKPKESQLERSKAKTPEQREEDREAIVEKSLQLKKHFENEPLPNDPRLVARILVAEHILALNQQLEEQNPHRKDVTPEELSIALDYMGSLAEKLENPSVEASPDIEEAYVALIELTEEALQTATPEEIVEHATKTIEAEAAPDIDSQSNTPLAPLAAPPAQATIPGSTNQPKPTALQPQPSLPIPPSPSAAILVTTLAALPVAVINQQKQIASPPQPAVAPQETGGYYPSYTPSETAAVRPSPAEARNTPNRPAIGNERETPRTLPGGVAPIAAIALTAAIATSPERTPRPPTASAQKPAPQETSYVTEVAKTAQSMADSPSPSKAIQRAREAPPTYTHDLPPYEAAHPATPPPSHEVVAAYTKKIEHLPLHTLLTMAENVPLGYGRYLRQEFESNQIDKAGLIKVLKAHSKGRDFSMEYREQAARFRSIKSSPEFLRSSAASESTANDDISTEQTPKRISDTPVASKPAETPKTFVNQVKAAASRISSQEDLPSLPSQSQTPWIIAIIIALIILTAILLFMF